MIPVMEEIILTCLVLVGSVQISDDVTLVCAPSIEVVEAERELEPAEGKTRRPLPRLTDVLIERR